MSSSSDDDSSSSEASDLTTASEFDAFADEDETSPKSPNNRDSQPQTSAFAFYSTSGFLEVEGFEVSKAVYFG